MKKAVWFLELLSLVLVSLPLAVLPLALSKKAGGLIGLLSYHIWLKRRHVALENVSKAVERGALSIRGAPEEVVRENFKNLGISLSEVIKVYFGLGRKIIRKVSIKGAENFKKALLKEKGVIFVSGHAGNWEILGLALSAKVQQVAVVVRPLDNPFLNAIVEGARASYGNIVIHKKGAIKGIFSALKGGGTVGILMDQAVLPEEGVTIEFLGAPAWTTKMPALIGKKTSAALIPVFIRRTAEGHEITIHPEVPLCGDEREDTENLSSYIEDYVRENPAEWLWMHRRWKRA